MANPTESDGQKFSHLYSYSGANKAGMDGIDKEKQAHIIYELSKDSAYFKRAAKLDAETDAKVQIMKKTLINFKGSVEHGLREKVLHMSMELEKKRSFERICCVLDMDMFFAAVEIRDQPHLKELPVAVGGMSMISTANYVARKYGVRAAMPGFIAKKLCPQLVFVHSNFDKYQYISGQIIDIIKEYDPHYSSHSLDEVYFDLTTAAKIIWCSEQGFFHRKKGNQDKQGDQYDIGINSYNDVNNSGSGYSGNYTGSSSSASNCMPISTEQLRDTLSLPVEAPIQPSTHPTTAPTTTMNISTTTTTASTADTTTPHATTTSTTGATTTPSARAMLFSKVSEMNEIFQNLHESDLPNIHILRNIAVTLLQEIRYRITIVTKGLTCSAGIANNYYLAKICADINKPNGQYELPPCREKVLNFVMELSTRKVGGIGKVTERILERLLDIKTMGQVYTLLPQLLYTCTPVLFQFLLRTSMGIGVEEGETTYNNSNTNSTTDGNSKKPYQRKSLGCERTYSAKGIQDPIELYQKLHKICVSVGEDMIKDDLYAKTLTLKLKDPEFILTTRSITSLIYFQTAESIENLAKSLLTEALPMKVRLMGVSVSKFRHEQQQDCIPGQRSLLTFLQPTADKSAATTTSSTAGVVGAVTTTTSTATSSRGDGFLIQEDSDQGGADEVVSAEQQVVEEIVRTKHSSSSSSNVSPPIHLSDHQHQQKVEFDLTSSPSGTGRKIEEYITSNNINSNSIRDSSSSSNLMLWLESSADTTTALGIGTALPRETTVVEVNAASANVHLLHSVANAAPATAATTAAEICNAAQRRDFVCPVCTSCITGTLGVFNAHLDRCLHLPLPTPPQQQQEQDQQRGYSISSNMSKTASSSSSKRGISTHCSSIRSNNNNSNNSNNTSTTTTMYGSHKRPRQEALVLSIPDYFTPK